MYQKVRKSLPAVIGVNISSTCGFLTAFYALNYIDPATMLCLDMGTLPIASFFLFTKPSDYHKHKGMLLSILFVIGGMGMIIYQNLQTLPTALSWLPFAKGALLACTDGVAFSFVGVLSEKLHRNKLYVSEVAGTRFILVMCVSLILSLCNGAFVRLTPLDMQHFLLSALLVLILPVPLYQLSIAKLGASLVAVLMSLVPILAYFIQLYTGRYQFNAYIFTSLLICSLAICLLNIMKKRAAPTSK